MGVCDAHVQVGSNEGGPSGAECQEPFLPSAAPFISILTCDAIMDPAAAADVLAYIGQWLLPDALLIFTCKLRKVGVAKTALVVSAPAVGMGACSEFVRRFVEYAKFRLHDRDTVDGVLAALQEKELLDMGVSKLSECFCDFEVVWLLSNRCERTVLARRKSA